MVSVLCALSTCLLLTALATAARAGDEPLRTRHLPFGQQLASAFSHEVRELETRQAKLVRELIPLPVPTGMLTSTCLGWHTKTLSAAAETVWVRVDLGRSQPLDAIVLVPASGATEAQGGPGYGFPLRFRIEVAALQRRHEIELELARLATALPVAVDATLALVSRFGIGALSGLVLFAAGSLWRARIAKRRAVKELRTRIASDLHDDIGSQLAGIALAAQLAAQKANDPVAVREGLADIERTARETTEAMHDMVWLLRPGSANLAELTTRLRETATTQLRECEHQFEQTRDVIARPLSIEFTRNVFAMFCTFEYQVSNRLGAIILALFVATVPLSAAEASPNKDATADLVQKAERALRVKPPSVTQKSQLAPSGNPNDYASTAPYFWPDPAKPDGRPYVRHDGKVYPGSRTEASDVRRAETMSSTVATLVRAYEATREEKYAANAALCLRTWFLAPETRMTPHLNFAQGIPGVNTGRQIGIIEGGNMVSALEQGRRLVGSKSWTGADQTALMKWADEFLTWYITSPFGVQERDASNNHGTHYDVQVMRMALMLERLDLARKVAETAKQKRIAAQIETDGRQPQELTRATSFSYSKMNLEGMMSLANLADRVSVDLWHYETKDGRSIRKALDFIVPYLKDPAKKWPGSQIKGFDRAGYASMLRQAAVKFNEPAYDALAAALSKNK
jgi:signal transduction histidine kinase